MNFCIPKYGLTLGHIVRVIAEFRTFWLSPELIVDVSAVQQIDLLGAMLLSSAIRQCNRLRTQHQLVATQIRGIGHSQGHEYASWMRLWDAINENHPRLLDRQVSRGHLPITRIKLDALYREAGGYDPIRSEVVLRMAAHFAKTLTAEHPDQDTERVLEHAISELLRNVIEHSSRPGQEGGDAWIACTSRWGDSKQGREPEAHVVILDEGRGIRDSLSENPAFRAVDHADAIRASIRPGVSANTGRKLSGQKIRRLREQFPGQDPSLYENHGFGLYVISQITRYSKGKLTMISGDTAITYDAATEVMSPTLFQGTAISLTIYPNRLNGVLDRVVAAQARATANASSLISASMLRRLGMPDSKPN